MFEANLLILVALTLSLSGTAFKRTFIDISTCSKRLQASSSDYDSFASSLVLNAAAIKNKIAKPIQNLFPAAPIHEKTRLFEPISVDYITSLETKDFFPFFVVSVIALSLSALSQSLVPAQLIFTAEMSFVIFCSIISTFKLNVPAYHVELKTDRDWDLLWGNVLKTVTCPRDFFASWFLQTTFDEIRREDAYDFLCWAMYSSLADNLNVKQAKSVERALCQIEYASYPEVRKRTIGEQHRESSLLA
jgi:hypothetical protein